MMKKKLSGNNESDDMMIQEMNDASDYENNLPKVFLEN